MHQACHMPLPTLPDIAAARHPRRKAVRHVPPTQGILRRGQAALEVRLQGKFLPKMNCNTRNDVEQPW